MTPVELQRLLSVTQYPQMTVNESVISRAWLMKHGLDFDRVEFNSLLGNSIELGPEVDEVTRRQAAQISAKRSDIIAWHGNEATIVEVKPRLSFSALGQLLGYRLLFHLEHPEITNIHLVAIGHDASVDTPEVLLAHGAHVELFPNVTLIGARFGAP